MRIKFGVTSSNNRKINLYRKHRENKLQALTKMVATYACKDIQSYNLHYHVCHEEGNSLLGRFLLYHLSSLHTETKSVKKGQLHMIALM